MTGVQTCALPISTGGALAIQAASLTAAHGASHTITAAGDLALRASAGDAASAGAGATVTIRAATLTQAGRIELPSGTLLLQAGGVAGGAAPALRFEAGSITTVRGNSQSIDGVHVDSPGGSITARADNGGVLLAGTATLDVSAAGAASGGALRLAATQGDRKSVV